MHGFILEAFAEKTAYQVENPVSRLRETIEALNLLEHDSLIGCPANNDKRELVVGRGSHGYPGLCRYIAEIDTVFCPCRTQPAGSGLCAALNEPENLRVKQVSPCRRQVWKSG